MQDITQALNAVAREGKQSSAEVLEAVYQELRRLAAQRLTREPPGQTLQPTALVHEAWLRLTKGGDPGWEGRGHFFAAAAEAMRRILVERARARRRARHGGGLRRASFDDLDVAAEEDSETVLTVSELLDKLAAHDAAAAELIKLRFFAGLPNREAAEIVGLSERTAKRKWAYARAWLRRELDGGHPEE